MKLIYVTLLTMFSTQVMPSTNCAYKIGKDLCADVKFLGEISRKSDSKFDLVITDKKGKAISLEKAPKIHLWMVMEGGHGHGSDPLKITAKDGKYSIENVWFLMRGNWDIKIEFNYLKKKYNASIPVCIKRKAADSRLGNCKN